MLIRKATSADAHSLAQVFYASVRSGPSPYSQAQRAAWMPHAPDPTKFAGRLSAKQVVVCEKRDVITGFMTFEKGGYIDLAFILHEHRGQGVFRALYSAIEEAGFKAAEARLWTHASLAAQPAFRAVGFLVMHHETVERAGEKLARAQMEKVLT